MFPELSPCNYHWLFCGHDLIRLFSFLWPSLQTFVATGTNLCLQFCPHALGDDKPKDIRPSRDSVKYDRENNKVHLQSKFIMNGVCIKWIGWIDLDTLVGKARLVFDEEQALVSMQGEFVAKRVSFSKNLYNIQWSV